jgi:ABC-type enterochelin transport system permease subunit
MTDSPKRPRTISLILLLLLILGTIQLATVVALSRQSALLLDLQVKPDPRLRMIIAVVWMALYWGIAIALRQKVSATRWLIPLLLALNALYELVVRGLFAQVPVNGDQWLLNSLFAAAFVLFAWWALNRNAAKTYYLEDKLADA